MGQIPVSVMAAALDDLEQPRRRPNPLEWLRYALTASAPPRCRTWVLHDVTTRTWVLRHAARSLVLLATPVALVLLFLPASINIKLLVLLNAGLPAFLASMLFVLPAGERRLVHAGYPAELGQAIRQNRADYKQIVRNSARRERIAERRTRRRGAH
jgi:Family of unknown function (DUF5313)